MNDQDMTTIYEPQRLSQQYARLSARMYLAAFLSLGFVGIWIVLLYGATTLLNYSYYSGVHINQVKINLGLTILTLLLWVSVTVMLALTAYAFRRSARDLDNNNHMIRAFHFNNLMWRLRLAAILVSIFTPIFFVLTSQY